MAIIGGGPCRSFAPGVDREAEGGTELLVVGDRTKMLWAKRSRSEYQMLELPDRDLYDLATVVSASRKHLAGNEHTQILGPVLS